jgi:hypothetical protein
LTVAIVSLDSNSKASSCAQEDLVSQFPNELLQAEVMASLPVDTGASCAVPETVEVTAGAWLQTLQNRGLVHWRQ